ncbi:MAG: PTS sugar transporter subunit IIA [Deltaproteobacteria bacterium]|nr:PTS sugar transporter subunit IIA [Deltaproteobacteria bacterium]
MIAVVVVTHGRLSEEMVRTLQGVVGRVPQVAAVSTLDDDPEIVQAKIRAAVERVDDGEGALILTDMLGDTATNLSLLVAGVSHAEVVAGVNMPMLVKAASARRSMGLRELAAFIREYGRDHIFWASERGVSPNGAARR